jgi:hypothetical protein
VTAERTRLAVVLLALAALPARAADPPLSGAAFEAYASGKTLSFAVDGQIYGSEQYLPGRRVIWAFAGEECRRGIWYEADGQICFVYDDDPAPQCWLFFRGTDGLSAQFMGDPDGSPLKEVAQSPEPLSCPGPEVGV